MSSYSSKNPFFSNSPPRINFRPTLAWQVQVQGEFKYGVRVIKSCATGGGGGEGEIVFGGGHTLFPKKRALSRSFYFHIKKDF